MDNLVSVIMSTLNTKEEYLVNSIESILKQTYTNLELIVIVDGGNDKSILDRFVDDRIKIIIHEETLGLPESLNEAIDISNGKYIMRMDSDDISDLYRIEKQVNFMERNQELCMSATYYKEFGNRNRIVKEIFRESDKIAAKTYYINPIAHPTVMFRKDFLVKNNIEYDKKFKYSQDFELWTRIIEKGKIGILNEVLLHYRVHEKQVSKEKFDKQSELYYEILKRNLKRLDIEEENIEFLLMLNGRNKNINFEKLFEFIELSVKKNNIKKVYDSNCFEDVLKIGFVSLLIKNKCFLDKFFFKNLKYTVKFLGLKLKS